MNRHFARKAVHLVHALTSLGLIATGLLLEFPDLRARVVGGYGRQLLSLHDWISFGFIAAPALGLLAAGPLTRELRARLVAPGGLDWKKSHTVVSFVASALLIVSGAVLWIRALPIAVFDAALYTHIALAWVVTVSIPIHLIAARRAMGRWFATLLGLRRELGAEPASDDSP